MLSAGEGIGVFKETWIPNHSHFHQPERIHISVFSLLHHFAGTNAQDELFSSDTAIESGLAVERARDITQGELGVISKDDADTIVTAANIDTLIKMGSHFSKTPTI